MINIYDIKLKRLLVLFLLIHLKLGLEIRQLMMQDNYASYLSASKHIDTLLERYYLNFVYGSYNKKRVIFNDYSRRADSILLFGDSHLITFEHVFLKSKKSFSNLYSRRFHGLTLYGADPGKYPSRYSILADSLRKLNVQSIVICLGEVDCRNAIEYL